MKNNQELKDKAQHINDDLQERIQFVTEIANHVPFNEQELRLLHDKLEAYKCAFNKLMKLING